MLKEGMKIEARHVRRKQLSQYIDISHIKKERKVSESTQLNNSSIQLAKKRVSAELGSLTKRAKMTDESVSIKENSISLMNPGFQQQQLQQSYLYDYYKYKSYYRYNPNRKSTNGRIF